MILLFILLNLDYSDCVNVCNDWIQYKDIKCIKVLEKKSTEAEALNTCTKLDQSSILLTIHSKEEQEFLNNLLEKYQNISLNVWLGMKFNETFKWMDGTNTDFNNWSDDAVRDGTEPCAEMSLQKESLGKWDDIPCKKSALVVCQKKQEFNLNTLRYALDNLNNKIERQENMTKIYEDKFSKQQSQINSLIPIDFLYTQFPGQSSPQELWPNMNWNEVTKEYSGLFFRAEGGESLPFGQTQQANQSYISDVYYNGCYFSGWSGSAHCDTHKNTSLKQENWVDVSSGSRVPRNLTFYTTRGEVRPKNTAIRIFKRIQ